MGQQLLCFFGHLPGKWPRGSKGRHAEQGLGVQGAPQPQLNTWGSFLHHHQLGGQEPSLVNLGLPQHLEQGLARSELSVRVVDSFCEQGRKSHKNLNKESSLGSLLSRSQGIMRFRGNYAPLIANCGSCRGKVLSVPESTWTCGKGGTSASACQDRRPRQISYVRDAFARRPGGSRRSRRSREPSDNTAGLTPRRGERGKGRWGQKSSDSRAALGKPCQVAGEAPSQGALLEESCTGQEQPH